jgi:23S rRNA maturation-related 3'-5' exoribonuclease YhaM
MKKQFIADFKKRDEIVDDLFAVKNKDSPRPYKNGTMFTLIVSDKTGETTLNFFGGDKNTETCEIYSLFEVQDVIHIKGKTDDYRGPISISVNIDSGQIKKVEEFAMEDFMPMTKKDITKMKADFKEIISQIGNSDIKRLLLHIFDERFMEEYSKAAAASSNHHTLAVDF